MSHDGFRKQLLKESEVEIVVCMRMRISGKFDNIGGQTFMRHLRRKRGINTKQLWISSLPYSESSGYMDFNRSSEASVRSCNRSSKIHHHLLLNAILSPKHPNTPSPTIP